ncbi:MAG: 2-oxoacid:acceptor oxidoreductase subunit alpha [Bacteroidetes Order II. Incertae sedis bacterium]|nr:2-oxoacid:acceptor oxidoreductase subunit alpha [Bacteroidetes Order II. bacterium]
MEVAIQKPVTSLDEVTILFAGDSGDGMQLTGTQFTLATALALNDLATLPDFPAEIRAPQGTTYGVSAFQIHFGSKDIHTPGDEVNLLVAMNPAALKVNLHRVRKGGTLLVNSNAFGKRDLDLAKYTENPLENSSLDGFQVIKVPFTTLTYEALKPYGLDKKTMDRTKNMFALGLCLWMYSRPIEPIQKLIAQKFSKKPQIVEINTTVLQKGWNYGETTEAIAVRYIVKPSTQLPKGTYRSIHGNEAIALGLAAVADCGDLDVLYASYPITPASDILHQVSGLKHFGIKTIQAEDEIAAVGAAIGASFGGVLGVTGTSGPGLALKMEAIGLAVMTELPLVVINVQRGGPSTGLPTKTEQADLLQAMYGRNGEAPVCVLAASTPGDCFYMTYEACRIASKYMTPVILLTDGYLANGAEPWLIPQVETLRPFASPFATTPNATVNDQSVFHPYVRDPETLARPWAKPGTPGLEHRIGGIEKADGVGNVSYDPDNHHFMVKRRAEKVQRIQQEIPTTEIFGDATGELLVVGWGGTRGAIEAAVSNLREKGLRVSAIHLRHLNPLPPDLSDIFKGFRQYLVPELNNGQLVRILRDQYLLNFIPYDKIQGQPFKSSEIEGKILEMVSS